MSNICGMEYLKWSAANQDRMEFYDFLTGHSDSVLTISQSHISISRPCGFIGVLSHYFHQLVGSSVLAHVSSRVLTQYDVQPATGPRKGVADLYCGVLTRDAKCTNPCFQW